MFSSLASSVVQLFRYFQKRTYLERKDGIEIIIYSMYVNFISSND